MNEQMFEQVMDEQEAMWMPYFDAKGTNVELHDLWITTRVAWLNYLQSVGLTETAFDAELERRLEAKGY